MERKKFAAARFDLSTGPVPTSSDVLNNHGKV